MATELLAPYDALGIIDKEIAAEEDAIRELQTSRNACSPISKVPARVLAQIFLLAKLVAINDRFATYRYCAPNPKARDWLNVAGVCRNWRAIVLDAPPLWNDLNLKEIKHLDWVKLILARSKDTSLKVKCTGLERERAILSVVLSHIAGIQDLEISSNISHLLEVQEIIRTCTTNSSLTAVQSLKLNNFSYNTTTALIPEVLKMPSLQKLELSGIFLPSSIPPLPQLRRLRIANISSRLKNEEMTMAALLSCLSNTTSLEELEIDDALGMTSGRKKDCTTVELPKLSWISLTSKHFADSALFQYIHYPTSSRVKFHCTAEPPRGSDIRNLVAIFSHFASSDAAVRTNMLSLLYDSTPHQVHLIATITNIKYLDICCAASERDILLLSRLSAMLPFMNIQTLHIGGSPKISRADWANLIKPYENVRVLKAENVAPSFIEALLKSPEDNWPPLAIVEELELSNCFFDGRYSDPSLTPFVKQLLQERNDLEIPFDIVDISDCYILEGTVKELEEYDVLVDWDEETLQEEEEEEEKEKDDEEEEDDDEEYWRERYY